jgi:hypothetical protein
MSPDRDHLASAPLTAEPGDDSSRGGREQTPRSVAAPAVPEEHASDAQSAADPETDEPFDELATLRARLGAPDAPDVELRLMSRAERHFDEGDNRKARALLDELLAQGPVEPLERAARALRRRIRPDRLAVALFVLSLVALIVIWILAVSAFR